LNLFLLLFRCIFFY